MISISSSTFSIFLFLLFNIQLAAQSKSTEVNELAEEHFFMGKYDEAIQVLRTKMHESPLSSVDILLMGRCQFASYQYDSAMYYFNHLLSLQQVEVETKSQALLGLTMTYYRLNDIKAHRETLQKVSASANGFSNDFTRGYHLYTKGLLAFKEGNPNSQEQIISAISVFPKDHPDIIDMYVGLIGSYLDEGSTVSAQKHMDDMDSIIHFFPDNLAKKAKYYQIKGYMQLMKQDFEGSLHTFENNLKPVVLSTEEGWGRYMLGDFYRFAVYPLRALGRLPEALDYLQKYLPIAKEFHNESHFRFAYTYSAMSSIYEELSYHDLASIYRVKAMTIFEQQNDQSSQLELLYKRGINAFYQVQYNESYRFFDQILKFQAVNPSVRVYHGLANHLQSTILRMQGNNVQALDKANAALDIQNQLYGNHPRKSQILLRPLINKITILQNLSLEKDYRKVFTSTLDNLALNYPVTARAEIAFINLLSRELLTQNKLDSVQNLLSLVLPGKQQEKNQVINDDIIVSSLLRSRAYFRAYKHSGDSNQLLASFEDLQFGVHHIVDNRKQYRSPQDLVNYNTRKLQVFDQAISVAHEMYKLTNEESYATEAFRFMQLSKANALQESLNRNMIIQQALIPDSILQQVTNMRRQSTELTGKIAQLKSRSKLSTRDSTKLITFEQIMDENTLSFNQLMKYLETNFPNYYALNYEPDILSIAAAQQKLGSAEAIIEYFITPEHNYALTISPKQINFDRLPVPETDEVSRFIESLQMLTPDANFESAMKKFRMGASRLYEKVFALPHQHLQDQKIGKLYIVPHKRLNYVPFELLTSPDKEQPIASDAIPYLIKDYNISYAYSSALLFKDTPQEEHKKPFQLLAIAPSYGDGKQQIAYRSSFQNELSALYFNKTEVEEIGKWFDGKIVKGEKATKQSFMAEANQYEILHLAMHGFVDNDEPMYSQLVFSTNNEATSDDILQGFELYNMSLRTRMAVLSACNTGNGKLTQGEGIMSLARAFTYAGAESVVMSHWRVDDKSSSELMKYFYEALAQGHSKDEALRNAKLQFLESAHLIRQHPYFWGNFVLMGDPQPLTTAIRWHWYALLAFGLLMLAVILRQSLKKSRQQ